MVPTNQLWEELKNTRSVLTFWLYPIWHLDSLLSNSTTRTTTDQVSLSVVSRAHQLVCPPPIKHTNAFRVQKTHSYRRRGGGRVSSEPENHLCQLAIRSWKRRQAFGLLNGGSDQCNRSMHITSCNLIEMPMNHLELDRCEHLWEFVNCTSVFPHKGKKWGWLWGACGVWVQRLSCWLYAGLLIRWPRTWPLCLAPAKVRGCLNYLSLVERYCFFWVNFDPKNRDGIEIILALRFLWAINYRDGIGFSNFRWVFEFLMRTKTVFG